MQTMKEIKQKIKYFINNILPAIGIILLLSINPDYFCFAGFACSACFADDAQNMQMKDSLVKIIDQLQAIKPLITQAQQEQSANPRIKIHFDSWTDREGKRHNGLRQDIGAIQKALIQAVNQQKIEPRSYEPIKGDFIDFRG